MKKFILYTVFIIYCVSLLPLQTFALTAEEVRKQIDDLNSKIEVGDEIIKQYKSQITQTSTQKNTLANLIKELTLTRSKLIKEKEQIQNKISATGLVIKNISGSIEEKEKSLNISKESLIKLIKDLNQNENVPLIERLLSKESFIDFSRDYNNILSINEKIRENIIDVSLTKKQLLSSKTEKEEEQTNLTSLKNTLVQKEQVVNTTKKEKDILLNQTENEEAKYQKLLAEQIKRRDTFEKALEEYEASLKFILNPKLIPKAGSEVLSWPLSSILITSLYGDRCLLKLYGTCKPHYGLDFRAAVGTPVMAMTGGVVEGTGNTDVACQGASFGRWIFIKHDNGLSSTYGHLSAINIKTGDRVKTGDTIGLSGGTKGVFGSGSSTGPHLHVSVYASDGVSVDTVPSNTCKGKIFTQPIAAKTAHINPADYLPTITSAMIKK
ncbi:MAG: peptidoglycan DD-metalloendopeptidase family protein [Candidatus Pacebacteria bacterium]|nr:peptidoglycan DD-metalloendopeptidase family protein [Candidatus Paceibacterota bacterium]